MDKLLVPYLRAINEPERQARLNDLILHHASPVIRNTLRIKLGFYVDHLGANPYKPDVEDLYQEIILKVIQTITDLRKTAGAKEIRHFRGYVFRVATNACINYLRAKSPSRRRLKDKVRILLIRHPQLALWKVEGRYLCGFADWQSSGKPLSSKHEILLDESKLAEFRYTSLPQIGFTEIPLSKILVALFEWVEGPVDINTLVKALVRLMSVKDQYDEPLRSDTEILSIPIVEDLLEPNNVRFEVIELLHRFWEVLTELPEGQRDAYTFRFRDADGVDLFSLLIEGGIVNLVQLAGTFDRSVEEIRHLWSRLPMDGATAASELGVSTSQLHKWRYVAAKRVKNELKSWMETRIQDHGTQAQQKS